jgi:hypothetical protein
MMYMHVEHALADDANFAGAHAAKAALIRAYLKASPAARLKYAGALMAIAGHLFDSRTVDDFAFLVPAAMPELETTRAHVIG